jgi:two-component system NarL family sensor kinase
MTTATASTQHLDRIVAGHARRGAALHVRLRGILVTFVAVTVLWEPPQYFATECRLIAAGYVLWAIGVAIWFQRDPAHLVRLSWLVLTVDLLLFGVLNQLTGVSDRLSWTPYILVNGFLLVPLLAAAQLRPTLGIAIGAGTTALYLLSSIAAQQANGDPGTDGEPWSSIVLRTFVVAGVSIGAVLLSRVQRGRVADIARLAGQRAELLSQLSSLENRQRRELAEALHDGALQYLLGARLELEEARETGNSDAFDRVDEALTSSAQLLRSTVGELHPAVLAQAGLAQALRDLAMNTSGRSRLRISVSVDPADDEQRASADLVLYSAARELLGNVVKHAQAQAVSISRAEDSVSVTVADDGCGIPAGALERELAAGHIGIVSHRLRVEALGGQFNLAAATPHGTVATVVLPTVG